MRIAEIVGQALNLPIFFARQMTVPRENFSDKTGGGKIALDASKISAGTVKFAAKNRSENYFCEE